MLYSFEIDDIAAKNYIAATELRDQARYVSSTVHSIPTKEANHENRAGHIGRRLMKGRRFLKKRNSNAAEQTALFDTLRQSFGCQS